jgi:hypothetical protein
MSRRDGELLFDEVGKRLRESVESLAESRPWRDAVALHSAQYERESIKPSFGRAR